MPCLRLPPSHAVFAAGVCCCGAILRKPASRSNLFACCEMGANTDVSHSDKGDLAISSRGQALVSPASALNSRSAVVDALAGSISGICGVFVGQPFDTIRVRQQTNAFSTSSSSSMISLIRAGGLYRGLIPPLLTSGCISSVVFSSYETMKVQVASFTGRPVNDLDLQGYYFSGFGCGVLVSVLTSPVHRVKILLQTSNISASKHTRSAWGRSFSSLADTLHCYKTVVADGGLRNLYHGYSLQLAVESLGRGAYFSAYELCKQYFSKQNGDALLPLHHRVASGALAGLVGWTFIYPLDVLKSRVQQQRLQPKQLQPGVLSAARAMLEESQGFSWRLVQLIFKGYPATAIRGIPVAATVLPVYDWMRSVLSDALL